MRRTARLVPPGRKTGRGSAASLALSPQAGRSPTHAAAEPVHPYSVPSARLSEEALA